MKTEKTERRSQRRKAEKLFKALSGSGEFFNKDSGYAERREKAIIEIAKKAHVSQKDVESVIRKECRKFGKTTSAAPVIKSRGRHGGKFTKLVVEDFFLVSNEPVTRRSKSEMRELSQELLRQTKATQPMHLCDEVGLLKSLYVNRPKGSQNVDNTIMLKQNESTKRMLDCLTEKAAKTVTP